MANIILKLIPNKWDTRHYFSFIKVNKFCPKDQHFLAHNNYNKDIKPGEFWECFIWSRREIKDKILFKVIPFTKVDEKYLKNEKRRVEHFNKELAFLEKFIGKGFEKVVFRQGNVPYLLANKPKEELVKLYPAFSFLQEPEALLAKPPDPPRFKKPSSSSRPFPPRHNNFAPRPPRP
ncbi:MAG: hypothetical protein V1913_14940 [Fibrobacterota bacterium]